MWWVWGTLVPIGSGGRLTQRAQRRLPLPRVRQDGYPRPPHRRNCLHHQVTTEEQHPARKLRRLARIAKLAPHIPHPYGGRPVAFPPSPPGGSLSSFTLLLYTRVARVTRSVDPFCNTLAPLGPRKGLRTPPVWRTGANLR